MIPYETYKTIHFISLAVLVTGFALQFYGAGNKLHRILTGVATLTMLVSGMGLLARIGVSHGEPWPLWVNVKMAVWFVVGVGGAVVARRFPRLHRPAYWVMLALVATAATSAVHKWGA